MSRPAWNALLRTAPALALAWLVAACSEAPEPGLAQWMEEQRARVQARVAPIEPPAEFAAQPYEGGGALDPFDAQRLLQLLRRDAARAPALLDRQLQRPKEPLEAYPLDAMQMVGSLSQGGREVALLRIDRRLYPVEAGHHIGQNYGRVTRVSPQGIDLLETVQDAAGEWIERPATLHARPGPQEGPGR